MKIPLSSPTLATAVCILLFSQLMADDWPQWQGPNRDSKSAETGLLKEWPSAGPRLAWTSTELGLGYSGSAVVGSRIFVMGSLDNKTHLIALNAEDGSKLWSAPINTKSFDFKGNAWGIGPRATPTVSDGHVYGLAGDGEMVCTDFDGAEVWRLNMQSDLNGEVNPIGGGPKVFGWGYCWSPLVDGDKLICVPGGADGMVIALDKKTGKPMWRSSELTDSATYASPILAEIDGVRQYVVMTQQGVASVAAADGKLLWYHKRKRPYDDVVIPTPIHTGNYVYASVGYGGAGCDLLKVTSQDSKFSVESLYSSRSSKTMKNNLGGFVFAEGHIYGCSDRRGWICQELESGDLAWYVRGAQGFPDGSIAVADGHAYLLDERGGEVALVELSSEEWKLKGRFTLPALSEKRAPSGRTWTHPVIANGKLYIRDQELLYCYDIGA